MFIHHSTPQYESKISLKKQFSFMCNGFIVVIAYLYQCYSRNVAFENL